MFARWFSSVAGMLPFLSAFALGFVISLFVFAPSDRAQQKQATVGGSVVGSLRDTRAKILGGSKTDGSELTNTSDSKIGLTIDQKQLMIKDQIAEFQKLERELVVQLRREVRILCWIMTSEKRSDRQQVIVQTWGKRCGLLLFIVAGGQGSVNMSRNAVLVHLEMPETYQHLWQKTRLAFDYVHQNYRSKYDWVLKIDDDSFVIMENLQMFLRKRSVTDPYFYGAPYKAHGGYNSGGPGYVISMKNLEKLIQAFNGPADKCSKSPTGYEDIEVARCLRSVGIKIADTRDNKGRFRWSPFRPTHTINKKTLPSMYNWFWGFTAHELKEGLECCAEDFISFHYIKPDEMRVMEFLIYYVHPFSAREVWE